MRRTLQQYGDANPLKEKKKATLPSEIIFFDILTRLPVKVLLQFRSVSKLWCSVLTSPPFINLHLTRSLTDHLDGVAMLVFVSDRRSKEQHFLSATHLGGPVTHLLTLPNSAKNYYVSESLNGLFCLNRLNFITFSSPHDLNSPGNSVYLCNPATQELARLPLNLHLTGIPVHMLYNFGFDSLRNQYKVLHIRAHKLSSTDTKAQTVCEIFTMGTDDSWRKINPVFPFNVVGFGLLGTKGNSVCLNDSIHWILGSKGIIVAFDLKDEKFRLVPLPFASSESDNQNSHLNHGISVCHQPYLIKLNGLLAVICHEHVAEENEMEMWTLVDYQNEVWTTEKIRFPSPWAELVCPFPYGTIYTGEILFVQHPKVWGWASRVGVTLFCYNVTAKKFRRVEVNLFPEWLSWSDVEIRAVRCYTESMLPLGRK